MLHRLPLSIFPCFKCPEDCRSIWCGMAQMTVRQYVEEKWDSLGFLIDPRLRSELADVMHVSLVVSEKHPLILGFVAADMSPLSLLSLWSERMFSIRKAHCKGGSISYMTEGEEQTRMEYHKNGGFPKFLGNTPSKHRQELKQWTDIYNSQNQIRPDGRRRVEFEWLAVVLAAEGKVLEQRDKEQVARRFCWTGDVLVALALHRKRVHAHLQSRGGAERLLRDMRVPGAAKESAWKTELTVSWVGKHMRQDGFMTVCSAELKAWTTAMISAILHAYIAECTQSKQGILQFRVMRAVSTASHDVGQFFREELLEQKEEGEEEVEQKAPHAIAEGLALYASRWRLLALAKQEGLRRRAAAKSPDVKSSLASSLSISRMVDEHQEQGKASEVPRGVSLTSHASLHLRQAASLAISILTAEALEWQRDQKGWRSLGSQLTVCWWRC
jgi:hypothetical protein